MQSSNHGVLFPNWKTRVGGPVGREEYNPTLMQRVMHFQQLSLPVVIVYPLLYHVQDKSNTSTWSSCGDGQHVESDIVSPRQVLPVHAGKPTSMLGSRQSPLKPQGTN